MKEIIKADFNQGKLLYKSPLQILPKQAQTKEEKLYQSLFQLLLCRTLKNAISLPTCPQALHGIFRRHGGLRYLHRSLPSKRRRDFLQMYPVLQNEELTSSELPLYSEKIKAQQKKL